MRSPSEERRNCRALPRWVTWWGTLTIAIRGRRAVSGAGHQKTSRLSVPGFQPAMKGQGAEVSEQSKVLGSALAVVLLSSPAAAYGFFYLASLVVGRSGDNWFSRQAALREVILTSWFITSMFGVYLGVASIAVYIMHLRKNSPVWVKVVTTTLLLLSIIGVLVVVLQIQKFGH